MRTRTELMSLSRSILQSCFKASLTSVNLSSDWTSSEKLTESNIHESTKSGYLQRHLIVLRARLQLEGGQKYSGGYGWCRSVPVTGASKVARKSRLAMAVEQ